MKTKSNIAFAKFAVRMNRFGLRLLTSSSGKWLVGNMKITQE